MHCRHPQSTLCNSSSKAKHQIVHRESRSMEDLTVSDTDGELDGQIGIDQNEDRMSNTDNRLCSLPSELIWSVLDHLDFPSSCSLRLVCSALRTKSWHRFASKYCIAKTIDFRNSTVEVVEPRRYAIDDLAYWSKHAFSSAIETLYFQPFDLDYVEIDVPAVYPNGEEYFYDRRVSRKITQKFGDHLIKTKKLVKIFSRLTNLRKIHIYDVHDYLKLHIERDAYESDIPIPSVSQALRVVLNAVARSGMRLDTFKMTNFYYGGKEDGAAIQELNLRQLQLSAFASVRSLRLWLSTKHNDALKTKGWEMWVARFISAAPSLEKLQLSLDASKNSRQILNMISTTVELPFLHKLVLDRFYCTTKDVIQLVQKYVGSLRHLNLGYSGDFGEEAAFVNLLEQLRDTTNLTRLVISHIWLKVGQVHGKAIFPGFNYASFDDVPERSPLDDEDWVIVLTSKDTVEIEEDQDFKAKTSELIEYFEFEDWGIPG